MNHRFLSLLLIFLSTATLANAEVYKHIADDGTVFYSDKPLKKGDKAYKSQDVMKFKAPPQKPASTTVPHTPYMSTNSRAKNAPTAVIKKQAERYESISMSPQDGTAIRSNSGSVTLSANLKPALQTAFKHQLVFIMDGSTKMKSGGNSATFQNVDRGTHQFSAQVEDENGQTLLQSNPISLHIQRFSVHRAK